MARRSSSGGRSGSSRPAARAPLRNPPKPAASSASSPAPAQNGNRSVGGGLGAAIADGLAWGTGTAIGHRVVDSIFGPRVIKHETVATAAPEPAPAPTPNSLANADACGGQTKAFSDCLNSYGNDITKCQFYMDMLQECRRTSGAVA